MCLICVDYQLGKLNIREAKRNLSEMAVSATDRQREHLAQVWEIINEDEWAKIEEAAKSEMADHASSD